MIESVYTVSAELAVSPNRIDSSKRFTPFCGGALNTPLSWDSGGVASPYSAQWTNGASGDLIIEIVDANDTTRLTALGIDDLGPLGAFGTGVLEFYIAVLDMQCASAPNPDYS